MRIVRTIARTLLLAAVMTIGSGSVLAQNSGELSRAQVRMADALKQGDAKALASCYTEDARLSFPLRPDIEGRTEIERQMSYVIGLGIRSFHIIEDDFFVGDDVALQGGTCIFYNETGQEVNRSRFYTVWHRVDGRWLIHRDFVV